MKTKQDAPISLAVVTGGHAYDVKGFHGLFRRFPEFDAYIQHMDDFCSSPEDVRDETYLTDEPDENSHVVLFTDHPRSTRAIAWTRKLGAARVFCYQSGHDDQAWSDTRFQRVLTNGIEWAAQARQSSRSISEKPRTAPSNSTRHLTPDTHRIYDMLMTKKLVQHGNSAALIIIFWDIFR